MATREIQTKLSLEGESQYRASLKNINSELKTLQSELGLVTAEYGKNATGIDALSARGQTLNAILEAQQSKVKTTSAALQTAKSNQEKWRAALEQTRAELAQVNASLDSYGDGADDAGEEVRELQERQKQLSSELKQDEAGYEQATRSVNSWQQQANNAKAAELDLTRQIEENTAQLNAAQSAADGEGDHLEDLGKSAKNAGEGFGEMGDGLTSSGDALTLLASSEIFSKIEQGIEKIVDAFAECINVVADFESTMATVQAVSGATEDELNELSDTARSYASTTTFTASDVASAYTYMGMAGWEAGQMLDGLPGIMALSAASGEDLGSVCDIVTDALTAFGLSASDAAHFSDVLAEASSDSNTTVALLGESFKMVGAQAGAMGYSVEDVTTALGAMANAGIKGSEAGTQLSTAITRMAGGNETAAAELENLGISMFDEAGNARELSDVLDDLRSAFSGMTDEEQANAAAALAGQKAQRGLLAIINTSDEDWQSLTDSINDCSGAAESMQDIKLDTYSGQVALLQSAVEGLKTEVGEDLMPVVEKAVEVATGVINKISSIIEEHSALVPVLVGVTVAIGTLTAGVTLATAVISAFNIISSAMSGNVLGLVTGLGAAAAALGITSGAMVGLSASGSEAASVLSSVKSSAEDWQDMEDSIGETSSVVAATIPELEALVAANDGTAESNARIQASVDLLNDSIDGLNLSYDEQTGSLSMTNEELEAYAENLIQSAKAAAYQERLTELIQEQIDLEDALAQANDELAGSMDGVTESNLASMGVAGMSELRGEANDVNDLTAALAENEAEQERVTGLMIDSSAAAGDAEDEIGSLADAEEDLSETTAEWVDYTLEELEAMNLGYEATAAAALQSMDSQIGKWNDLAEAAEYNMTELVQNMQDWATQQQTYAENLATISAKYGPEIAQIYADSSDASIAGAAVLASATDDEIASYMEAYNAAKEWSDGTIQAYTDTAEAAANGLDGSEGATAAAESTAESYAEGLSDGTGGAEDAAGEVGEAATDTLEDAADDAYTAGQQGGQKYADGAKSKSSAARSAGQTLKNNLLSGIKCTSEMYTSGVNAVQGFINGVNAMMGSARSVAASLANEFTASFRSAAGEGSPWKTTIASGEFAVQGLVKGVTESLYLARGAAAQLASAAQPDLSGVTANLSEVTAATQARAYQTAVNGAQSANGGTSSSVTTLRLTDAAGRILATGTTLPYNLSMGDTVSMRLAARGLSGY